MARHSLRQAPPPFGLLLAPLLFLAACAADSPPPPPWQVEVAGCETWLTGPSCAIGQKSLQIWVSHADFPFEVFLDGQKMAVKPAQVMEGLSFEIQVPSGAQKQKLALLRPHADPFELVLVPSPRPSWYNAVATLFRAGDFAAAQQLAKEQAERSAPWENYFAARIAHQRDERPEAARLASRNADLWLAADLPGQAINDLVFAAQMLAVDADFIASRQRLVKARETLEALSPGQSLPLRPHFLLGLQEATLAFMTADFRGALTALEQLDAFRRHGLLAADECSDLDQLRATVLGELGRFEEAAELLAELEPLAAELTPARRADLAMNRGWIALLGGEAGKPLGDAKPFFEEAWRFFSEYGNDDVKLNCKLNLMAAEMLAGRYPAARKYLEEAAPFRAKADADRRGALAELEARLLLREGKVKASLERYEELDRNSGNETPALHWQVLVGKAQAESALGRSQQALESFERAELLEDRELLAIPIDQGRETFLARRQNATRSHLGILLAQGQSGLAQDLVRHKRAQALRLLQRDEIVASLDPTRRERWDQAAREYQRRARDLDHAEPVPGSQRPEPQRQEPQSRRLSSPSAERSTELAALLDQTLADLGLPNEPPSPSPPRPGELDLTFFSLEDSWLLFADDGDGKPRIEKVETAPGTDIAAIAPELLRRVREQIHRSERVKIYAWGDLDYHALLFEGRPLVEAKPIVYGVDAGHFAEDPVQEKHPRRVLLVGDPSGTLLSVENEIATARKTLSRRAGFALGPVLLQRDAEAGKVKAALEQTDFFHFAGHSHFYPAAGSQSRIALRGGDLSAGDLLAGRKGPAQVVLSSCSAGQAARSSGVEGLGLAQAFVLAGSRQVLAAIRDVNDQDAAALIAALYEYLDKTDGEIDLAAALREAQMATSRAKPSSDWQAFRVFEP